MDRDKLIAGAVCGAFFIFGATAGGSVAWIVARRKLAKKFELDLERELKASEKFIKRYHTYESPAAAVDELIPDTSDDVAAAAAEALVSYKTGVVVKTEDVADVEPDLGSVVQEKVRTEVKNVFAQPPVNPEKPYIIAEHEYMANDEEYTQCTLTFFAGDKVLMDDDDTGVINDVDDIVGIINLRRFGHKSNNEHLVYVRNDRLKIDYEIQRSPGKYTVEVLGETEED